MKTLPAEDFLKRFVSAYGQPWEDTFADAVCEPPCAKHMAEFIDDVERYGQQTPVFVDKSGMVSDGHKIAMALNVLGEEINYVEADAPKPSAQQLWVIEFDMDGIRENDSRLKHTMDYLSFRVEEDWVYPIKGRALDERMVLQMYCPSGLYTAERLDAFIPDRMRSLAGIDVTSVYLDVYHKVDGDAL